MEFLAAVLAWAFGLISLFVGYQGLQFPLNYFFPQSLNITADLGPQLSPGASIFLPGSSQFESATTRWQQHYRNPSFRVAVQVATERDVQQTILYANQHRIPFLAVSGGHGATASLTSMKQGIGISMRSMNQVRIGSDGTAATMGGGVIAKEVMDALWAAKKRTVTGVCECTGMLSPLLGGGHGWLQGHYGLIADQLIEARLVLANGTAVTVSSTLNQDLFWALRGAGHNFGVVTEFKIKIYDVPSTTWTYDEFIFTHDKLEALYELFNKLHNNGAQPAGLIHWSEWLRLPDMDPEHPVILSYILYEGPASEEGQYGAPFHALGPKATRTIPLAYPDIQSATRNDLGALVCQPGVVTSIVFPVRLQTYDIRAQRAAFEQFSKLTAIPAFNMSGFLLEGYSVIGVKAVPAESTAYPFREDNLLVTPVVTYAPNSSLNTLATSYGQRIRDILKTRSDSPEHHAYINYAYGDETLEEIYGHEPWRLKRLRALKKQYDPKGRFNFYAPIW